MIFSHKHEMLSSFTIRIVRQNKLAKSQPWFGRSTGTEFKIWVDWWLYVYILLYDWYLISRRTQLSRILVAEITLFGVGEIVYIVLPGYCPIRFDWSFHSLLISSVQFRTNPQIFRTINSTLLYTLQPRTADMETPPCVYHFLVEIIGFPALRCHRESFPPGFGEQARGVQDWDPRKIQILDVWGIKKHTIFACFGCFGYERAKTPGCEDCEASHFHVPYLDQDPISGHWS